MAAFGAYAHEDGRIVDYTAETGGVGGITGVALLGEWVRPLRASGARGGGGEAAAETAPG